MSAEFVEEVSNPWREAIEADRAAHEESGKNVSNPWREAIEANISNSFLVVSKKFPILGGRLLKRKVVDSKCLCYKFPILGGRLLKQRHR